MSLKKILVAVSLITFTFLGVHTAQAQATRTWVSGVGDDANPCSRTAPCKTFAGAISKTAAKGEINVLDPGGFGAVTITKSISIESEEFAGVLVSGTNGIVISAASTDVVVLRGLTIEGLGTGLSGVLFLAGGTLVIEDCTINNFNVAGIDVRPSSATTAKITVKNTVVRNSVNASPMGGGVWIRPSGVGTADVSLERVRADSNLYGFRIDAGGKALAKSCVASMNWNNGFLANAPSGSAELLMDGCGADGNGQSGNSSTGGVVSVGAGAVVRITNSSATNNPNGFLVATGGAILSFGTNNLGGNAVNGSPTGPLSQQ